MSNLKQTIDFSVANPSSTENYSLPLFKHCNFNPNFNSWVINSKGGFFQFNLNLPQQQGVNLIFRLCGTTNEQNQTDCPISITINDQPFVGSFDPHISNFYDMVWAVPGNMLHAGNNKIVLTLIGGTTMVAIKNAVVDIYAAPILKTKWLSAIADNTSLSEINLPGTHDSAAIYSLVNSLWSCHNQSITSQLYGGIRVLDVRIQVEKLINQYVFYTCHGSLGSSVNANRYQSLISLLDECKFFLTLNPSEVVIISLKVDNWDGYDNDRTNVLNALDLLLSSYNKISSPNLLTLGATRGKIVLYNRINEDLRFGTPLGIPDNTDGSYVNASSNRSYNIYVQDRYTDLPFLSPDDFKLDLVKKAFTQKKEGEVLFNFASAVKKGVFGVYIMGNIISEFGKKPAPLRPAKFGWILFDYEFEKYQTDIYGSVDVVSLVIASNFNYAGFENQFFITIKDEL